MQKIYSYDPETGEFLAESIADIDPLGAGVLIPAFATDKTPPTTSATEIAVFSNDKWTKQPRPTLVELTLEQLRTAKLAEINNEYEIRAQQIVSGVPASEVQSWSKQEAEARAYRNNPEKTEALTLHALSQARGILLDVLVGRVIEKADYYSRSIGQLIGDRQKLEDRLNAIDLTAHDAAQQIEAIKWPE